MWRGGQARGLKQRLPRREGSHRAMLGRRPARAQDSGVWSGERLVGARWSTCRALNTPSPPPYPQVCVHCGATTTCFWRRAEKGDGYVCNACGGCLPLAARLLHPPPGLN